VSESISAQLLCPNVEIVERTIAILGLRRVEGSHHKMFDGKNVEGIAFELPKWRQAVVIDQIGTPHYDNYNGSWGHISELDKFLQTYAVEDAKHQAALNGFTVQQTQDEQGNVLLECTAY
jgi:hypothetical protein